MPKLLIIDDSGFQRNSIKQGLTVDGYEIIEAANGKEGIQRALDERPDFILLDMLMPDMNGVEVLTALKNEGMKVPVAIVTADIQETTEKTCMNLGAVGFVNKPVKGDSLSSLRNIMKCYIS